LTEKVARRGFHLSREYSVDPLEILFVREVMRTNVVALSALSTTAEMQELLRTSARRSQRLLPVVDQSEILVGVLTRADIRERLDREGDAALQRPVGEMVRSVTVVAHPDEPLRIVVYRMAEKSLTRLPVVDRETRKFLGLVALDDLLKARGHRLREERTRERPLKLRFFTPSTNH
jgi:CBS domain-containing protein